MHGDCWIKPISYKSWALFPQYTKVISYSVISETVYGVNGLSFTQIKMVTFICI